MTTITGAGGTHTPTLFLAYSTERQAGNSIEDLLDSGLSVQLRPATSRSGRFEALFTSLSTAVSLEADLALAQVLTLVEPSATALSMDFVCDGRINVDIDKQTRREWIVSWDFREVP